MCWMGHTQRCDGDFRVAVVWTNGDYHRGHCSVPVFLLWPWPNAQWCSNHLKYSFMYLRSTSWCFDTHRHTKVTVAVRLINKWITVHSYHNYFCCQNTWDLCSWQISSVWYNVTNTVTVLDIISVDLFILHNFSLIPFDKGLLIHPYFPAFCSRVILPAFM